MERMGNFNILEMRAVQSDWKPPAEDEERLAHEAAEQMHIAGQKACVYIFRTEPYIDTLFIRFDHAGHPEQARRFCIHEGFAWDYEDEQFFHDCCIRSDACVCQSGPVDRIYSLYSAAHPDWHLKRYYLHPLRVLDHVYHCMKQNTVKEMLYKAGLDELAAHIDDMDEINLMASRPADLYDGLPLRALRALNNREGAALISSAANRKYIRELNARYPDLFDSPLNEAHCSYLSMLMKGKLLPGETGRLFRQKKANYSYDWCRTIFSIKVASERNILDFRYFKDRFYEEIAVHDPIYRSYLKRLKSRDDLEGAKRIFWYLVTKKEMYDHRVRVSNRRRPCEWQERTEEYIVRFPQTVNDFVREAVYMQNCLLWYLDAFCGNDTTIMFIRKADDVNQPFISMEIQDNELKQAYHRYNRDCSPEEAEWITAWCGRHGIGTGGFLFDATMDELD